MRSERVIPARRANDRQIESFPYLRVQFGNPVLEEGDDNDTPLGSGLTTPEEDARRLASVDQVIFEKLQQAERDALDTARRGFEEGFQSGETQGREFGESQYLAHLQQLDGHLRELSGALDLRQRAAGDELIALAVALGEYLAGRSIDGGAETIQPMLDAILQAHPFPGAEGAVTALTVCLNPRDLAALGPDARQHPGVTLQEDAELTRGGLRIEAAEGVLDASMEHRRARMMELVHRFREAQEAR